MQKRVAELEEGPLNHYIGGFDDSAQRYHQILSETSFEAIVFSEDGILIDFNDQLIDMVGWQRDEMIGKSVMMIVAPDFQTFVTEAIRTGNLNPYETMLIRKDGTTFPVEIKARVAQINGKQIRATAVRDITLQKQSEAALRASERKFSKAFHTSPDSININRLADGLYLEINQGFTDIVGYKPDEVIGKTSLELDIWANPEDRATLVRGLRDKGEVENLEAEFKKKDGTTSIGLMSARVIDINGEMCILSVTRDIGARKKAELQIRHLHEELLSAYDETLEGWSRALNLRDVNTDKHSKRVVELSVSMARAVGISEENLIHVRRGAILHDIGKMGIPDYILLKPGPLTEDEWRVMRLHPAFGYEMLAKIPF